MRYRGKTTPFIKFFKDEEKMKTDLKSLVDKEKLSGNFFVLVNLFEGFGIGESMGDLDRYVSEKRNLKRDMSKEMRVITICKLEDAESGEKKPKGKYMRIVKGKGGMMGAIQASLLKRF